MKMRTTLSAGVMYRLLLGFPLGAVAVGWETGGVFCAYAAGTAAKSALAPSIARRSKPTLRACRVGVGVDGAVRRMRAVFLVLMVISAFRRGHERPTFSLEQ